MFHPFQVQDKLDEGEDDHGDADSPGVESGLKPPILGVIDENDEEDEQEKAKNGLRSYLQGLIPPQFAHP
jgi:hypothetical protein